MTSEKIIQEIDYVLNTCQSSSETVQVVYMLYSTIERLSPNDSVYSEQANKIADNYIPGNSALARGYLLGLLKSLRTEYEQGYLSSVEELIHADMFADFIEMAEYLLEAKFKDSSAVIIGGVLEEHLRKLCLKNSISVYDTNGKPIPASKMNDELAKAAYDKLQQKGVTYWLDLRNKAAHGKYTEYDDKEVRQMLIGVRDFINKFRA